MKRVRVLSNPSSLAIVLIFTFVLSILGWKVHDGSWVNLLPLFVGYVAVLIGAEMVYRSK